MQQAIQNGFSNKNMSTMPTLNVSSLCLESDSSLASWESAFESNRLTIDLKDLRSYSERMEESFRQSEFDVHLTAFGHQQLGKSPSPKLDRLYQHFEQLQNLLQREWRSVSIFE